MIESIAAIQTSAPSLGGSVVKATPEDASKFAQLLSEPNPVNESVKTFVEKAQAQLDQDKVNMDKKLRDFDTRDSVFNLVDAMHVSAMKSVSVQLTGKIGSKVSESFEQLVKQQ